MYMVSCEQETTILTGGDTMLWWIAAFAVWLISFA
jgi:hypothetical protein